jgi:hypothetical protein
MIRTRHGWALLAGLLQAGCGGGYVGQHEPAAPGACYQEVNQDPAVRQLRMKMAGTPWWRLNAQRDLEAVERDALNRCLRQKGLLPPGGVEAVRPLWYDPLF